MPGLRVGATLRGRRGAREGVRVQALETPLTGKADAAAPARFRECVRALILASDPGPAVLLIHLVFPDRHLWITPGGGIAPGETHKQALRRELHEELGRDDLEIGPHIWSREGTYRWAGETASEREFFYLVRADRFVSDLSGNPVPGEKELIAEARWWPVEELPAHSKDFAPARLGSLVADLLENGPPAQPLETGF